MRRPTVATLAALLVAAFALAGCLGEPQGPGGNNSPIFDDGDGNATPNGTGDGDDGDGSGGDGSDGDGGNGSGDNGSGDGDDGDGDGDNGSGDDDGNRTGPVNRTWPGLGQAQIRPGVQMTAGGSQCTAGFVLSSPDNATLYVATASHCVGGRTLGSNVSLGGIPGAGTVAYCSWFYTEGADGDTCPDSEDGTVVNTNDLALIAVRDEHRATVHPAMLHYGGPTELGSAPSPGTRLLTYGNSGLRPVDTVDPREGVVATSGDVTTTAYFAPPSIFGDSGSPAITASGASVGVLSSINSVPPGANSFVNLDTALAFAEDQAGIEAELRTWPMLDDGLLPL